MGILLQSFAALSAGESTYTLHQHLCVSIVHFAYECTPVMSLLVKLWAAVPVTSGCLCRGFTTWSVNADHVAWGLVM